MNVMVTQKETLGAERDWQHGTLLGKVAVITGAAGNLGSVITRRYLSEGATVVFTGRNPERTEAARANAVAEAGVPDNHASCVTMDAGKPDDVRAAIEEVIRRYGRIDILLNNAGSAGPRTTVENLPFTTEELAALRATGAMDTETVGDAVHNILGVAWNLVRIAAPYLTPGASVINVSSIFSRTEYFGRAAYVVPKAAMNVLSRRLAAELGPRGIRVNTLVPGPIASERIRSVFATMDRLRGDPQGSMATRAFSQMTLARPGEDGTLEKTFPTPADIAGACVFLGSNDSAAFNGADFEVTHGMQVQPESRSTWMARPTLRSVDAAGASVLLVAGNQLDEALAIARTLLDCDARVALALANEDLAAQARARLPGLGAPGRVASVALDRTDARALDLLLREGVEGISTFSAAVVLPAHGPERFQGLLSEASDAQIEDFVAGELCGMLAIARGLTRAWKSHAADAREPRCVFLTNGSDDAANAFSGLLEAATEELIRVWRDESRVERGLGRRANTIWANQIIRTVNNEPENVPFSAGHTARLLFKDQKISEINLYLPASIADASGARRALVGVWENLAGLHLGKVALITGGSAGIGGQVARLLALAGAKVMIVARRGQELEDTRQRIENELRDAGLPDPARRIRTLAGIDVGDPATLPRAVKATLAAFGRIDYLINNAGVSGAEEMAVDMSLEAWRYTLEANLISNYALTHAVAPLMKAQGAGYVLNVSSFFGGEKYLAVAYPNRSDYAVSKAGQRAMVETMARVLGPEIQFNAIAPGPVDGDRLAGTGGKPGLFERRGRLILEKKRLNAVHAGLIRALREGAQIDDLLTRIATNDTATVANDPATPKPLAKLATSITREGDAACHCGQHFLTPVIAERLIARLRRGGYLQSSVKFAATTGSAWLAQIPREPFFAAADLAREAEKVRSGVLKLLNLGKMPTETDIALATVFFLADRAVSGETFLPSGGLSLERSVTERELFGSPTPERLTKMRGETVWLIGEHLTPHLAEAARRFANDCAAGRIIAITRTPEAGKALAESANLPAGVLHNMACGEDLEACMEAALASFGRPTTVISTPFAPLPDALFDSKNGTLDADGFRNVVEANLTHHFRVARIASLLDLSQLVLVSPDVPEDAGAEAFALANFIKTTLHAFTLTLAVENERLVHDVVVNQVNLTRRVRSEEPRDEAERLEEVRRFGRACLLAGAPLHDLDDSRYRARINRGMAITV